MSAPKFYSIAEREFQALCAAEKKVPELEARVAQLTEHREALLDALALANGERKSHGR